MKTKKLLLMCSALLAVSAPIASATGLNIAWDTCVTDGGTWLRTSACTSNSNAGASANVLVQSIVLDTPMPAYIGAVCFINVYTEGSTLPSWWSCPGKLTPFSAVSGASPCTNDAYAMSGGDVTGGLAATNFQWNGCRNTVQGVLYMANAAGFETDLEANLEYFLGSITISNAKTAGPGACAGCEASACINFAQANLDHLVNGLPALPVVFRQGDLQPYVYWQTSATNCPGTDSECYPTPTRTPTWGAIKSLYR